MKERSHEEILSDLKTGNRSRGEIAENLLYSSSSQEHTQRLILEALLDIREKLNIDKNQEDKNQEENS